MRTRTTERPARRQSAREEEGKQKGRRRKRRRESERVGDGRDQPSQLSNANELLHWQIIRGSHLPRCDSFRNRVAGERRDGETLESSSESSPSHRTGSEIHGGRGRYSVELSSSTTKGWDRRYNRLRIGVTRTESASIWTCQRILDILKSRAPTQYAGRVMQSR